MWLSGLRAGLQSKRSLVLFPVRAHAWVVGQVPSRGHARGNHILMFPSLSLSLPLSLKTNTIFRKNYEVGHICFHALPNLPCHSHLFPKSLRAPCLLPACSLPAVSSPVALTSAVAPWARGTQGSPSSLLVDTETTVPLLKKCLLNLLGLHWLIKSYRFQVYNSITHHLYVVLCVRHPRFNLLPSPLIPPLPSSPSPPRLSLWKSPYWCLWLGVCLFVVLLQTAVSET